jgi:hypothetical protein
VRDRLLRRMLISTLMLSRSIALSAQSAQPTQTNVTPYAIPEAPAFIFLGATPAEVQRPTTPRSLATSLVSGISAEGMVQQGFALDIAPWSLIPSLRIPLQQYQRSPASFLLANTQLSFATVRTPGDDGSTDLSLGLRMTLWDKSDPMADAAFTDSLRLLLLSHCVPQGPEAQDSVAMLACGSRVNREYREEWRNGGNSGRWNRSSLALAGAIGTRLDQSRFDQHRWLGWSAWATGAFPLTGSGQILAQLRYDDRTPVDGAVNVRALRYGARAFLGGATVNAFLEVVGVDRIEAPTGVDEGKAQWSGGIEFRAGDQLWLSTGLGNVGQDESDRAVVIAGLRWNVLDAPRFGAE